jgi:hypothetical protein
MPASTPVSIFVPSALRVVIGSLGTHESGSLRGWRTFDCSRADSASREAVTA